MPIFSIEGIFPNNGSLYTRQRSTERKDSGGIKDQSRTRSKESKNTGDGSGKTDELTVPEKQEATKLAARDREVRAHEAAHTAAGRGLIKGGASFSYEKGPDGTLYAVGGEVSIDTSKVPDDPPATLAKANQIQAAALAPATPSNKDRSVAASASAMANEARGEIREQGSETTDSTETGKEPDSDEQSIRSAGTDSGEINNTPPLNDKNDTEVPGTDALGPSNRQTLFYTNTSQPSATPGNSIDLFA